MRVPAIFVLAFAAAVQGAAHAAEGKGGLPQLNAHDFAPQLVWLAISFVLLYLIMARLALPRIGEVLEERRDRIARDLEAAERLKGEAEKALAAYEKGLAEARAGASVIARQTREAVSAEVEKERAKIDERISAKVSEAEARIGATKSRALESVSEVAADSAAMIVERLIGENVSRDEIERALTQARGAR
jgi:F-type H+-transporting ATPase subunit b